MMKNLLKKSSKNLLGEGYFYRLLNKDIKEINKISIFLFAVIVLLLAGFTSYKLTNNSYALFTDSITGENTIKLSVNLDKSGANAPVLSENMIPVYYDENAKTWKKADSSNSSKEYKWYNYDEKMWANSVTVTSTNRSTYLSAEPGTEIPMTDILTMQVWIPRYKYKVWNYNADGTKTGNPQEIEITFEKGTSKTGEITCSDTILTTNGAKSESCKLNNVECTDTSCNGKYYTHPAFTFGEEELTGFWMGKFELTGTIDNITTKPNLTPIVSQTVGNFYNGFLQMNDSGNIYGFATTEDTHMTKNMEWGAVAYLSHSKYGTCADGICSEIGINNKGTYDSTSGSSGTITGCGAEAGSSSSSTCNEYNKEGVIASTTGNIYGVYDMSGGNNDFVSASMIKSDGNFYAPSGIPTGPARKYHDYYSYGTTDKDSTAIKRGKLGDATKESTLWYDDLDYQVYVSGYWMSRGLFHTHTNSAGIFAYHRLGVSQQSHASSRFSITMP